jgi:hypothetical protein
VRGDSKVRIFEVPNGFDVTSLPSGTNVMLRRTFFSHQDLLAPEYGARHRKVRLFQKHAYAPPAPPSSYQDLFRALGYELVDAGAYFILLDELDGGFLLTYQYHDPHAGFMLHKRRIMLHNEDQDSLRRAAVARRTRR